jgi:hypothetical protein
MKKHLWQIVALLAALLTASSALSQSNGGDFVVDVPFPFIVADRILSPGRYTVTHIGDHVLRIHGSDKRAALVLTNRVERSAGDNSRKMIFHRYHTVYFLSEVWDTPESIGRRVPKSRTEERLADVGADQQVATLRIQ